MRDKDETTRMISQTAVDGMQKRGRPHLRLRDLVIEVITRPEMVEYRKHWHVIIEPTHN